MIKEHDREIKMERLLYLLYMHKCFLPISNLSFLMRNHYEIQFIKKKKKK